MKTRLFLFALLGFSLIPIAAFAESSSYELDEVHCSIPRGMTVDENCIRIRPSPYDQQKDGIESQDVRCNHDLYRSYKKSDGTAFCATGHTLRELIHRGFAEPFDGLVSAGISGSNNTVNEYCPSSQELLQSGWYAYDNPTDVILQNIDLVYSAEGDSYGVEYTFDSSTNDKSMIWVFVECDDSFDTFEVIILPETIEHRKNFVVYYPDNPNSTIHLVNHDVIPYRVDGMPDTGVGTGDFTIIVESQDDLFIETPANGYDGVTSIFLTAANPQTNESYEWMNYFVYITEFGDRK